MNDTPQLKFGVQGRAVALLHSLLGLQPQSQMLFDEATTRAVKEFQQAKQLMVDGIVGPETWSALGVVPQEVSRPQEDGAVTTYRAVIRVPLHFTPRVYYVNGIQTDGTTHANTGYALSALTNRAVHGVYNATWSKDKIGMFLDLIECLSDWNFSVKAKLLETRHRYQRSFVDQVEKLFSSKHIDRDGQRILTKVCMALSAAERRLLTAQLLRGNRATSALYAELSQHLSEPQVIVAHSQGNLITANALWALTFTNGAAALTNLQIFSLASPAPAWPLGIRARLRTYHHDNDPVIMANPHNWKIIREQFNYPRALGDYGPYENSTGKFDPHFLYNFGKKDFARDIRRYLGLPDVVSWNFPK